MSLQLLEAFRSAVLRSARLRFPAVSSTCAVPGGGRDDAAARRVVETTHTLDWCPGASAGRARRVLDGQARGHLGRVRPVRVCSSKRRAAATGATPARRRRRHPADAALRRRDVRLRPRGKQPAIGMTHHAAMEYCRWLSAKTGKIYRLPTEAEWEYGRRAGTTTPYVLRRRRAETLGDVRLVRRPTPRTSRTRSARRSPTPGACTTCTATSPSGASISTRRSATAPRRGQAGRRSRCCCRTARYPHVARGGSWADEPDRSCAAPRGAARAGVEPARPATAAEHLVADRRRSSSASASCGRRGAGEPGSRLSRRR